MAHIIVVAVVKAILKIVVAACGESALYLLECCLGCTWVKAMYLHLYTHETVLSVVSVAQWLLNGLYTSSWGADDCGT